MSSGKAWQNVMLTRRGGIAILVLNRPAVYNAVDDALRSDLRAAVDHVAGDESVRGLVLTGAGRSFCAGGDIRGMEERLLQGARAAEIGLRRQRAFHETLTRLFQLDRPTVAAINGRAYGLGLDLALTCDFVWAAEDAVVASSYVKMGLVADGGGLFHLPRRVGLARAKELMFSGRSVPAAEALSMGLVDRVVPRDELVDGAAAWLAELADRPRTAQALTKGVLNRSFQLSLEEVNLLGSQAQAICYSTPDHLERVRDFLAARADRRSSDSDRRSSD